MIPASYYQSDAWQEKRRKYLKNKCAWCGKFDKPMSMTLHHKKPIPSTYEIVKSIKRDKFIGDIVREIERRTQVEEQKYLDAGEDDLITVCSKCHFLWEKNGMRLCPKCKSVYVKYPEKRCCDDCLIGTIGKHTPEIRIPGLDLVKPHKKHKMDSEIQEIRRKMAEKGPGKGKKWRITFGRNYADMDCKFVTVHRNQLGLVAKILRKNKKKILYKNAS